MDLVENIPRTTKDVGDMLSSTYAEQKTERREMSKLILSSIRFLGRQGLALRGRYKSTEDSNVGGEIDFNCVQLLKVRAEDDPKLIQWVEKSQDKFTSPDI